jgi:hypothetical protein
LVDRREVITRDGDEIGRVARIGKGFVGERGKVIRRDAVILQTELNAEFFKPLPRFIG